MVPVPVHGSDEVPRFMADGEQVDVSFLPSSVSVSASRFPDACKFEDVIESVGEVHMHGQGIGAVQVAEIYNVV